jgi:glycosyltransferase involved in cell wall biosynthesis
VIHHGIELETIPRRKKTDLTKNLIFAGRIIYGKGIQDRIIFAGGKAREDVLSLLSESDIFINPSYSEGLPISILEAGAVGLPVIATDVGGTKELIFPHQTGLLIPPRNPVVLRQAIEYVLENPDQAQRLAGNLNRLVRTNFGWEVLIQKWEKEIEVGEDEKSVLHGFG